MKEQKLTYDEINEIMKLSYLLKQTSETINRCRENDLRRFHITPEQAGVLRCIYNLGGNATPADLTHWLSRKPSSVSIMLGRMEKQGLISKNSDPKKKNIIRLSLTERGLEAYGYMEKYNSFTNIFKELSVDKQHQLWELLKPLLDRALKDLPYDNKHKYNFLIFDMKRRPYPEKPRDS
jgi:DNA-binding MarR family transcriptional regulator